MSVSAKVICDSLGGKSRLITMEIELHRFILPEFNTHRSFSRNFQSSRALPLARQRRLVLDHPATPVFWGSNKAGMVAGNELTGIRLWLASSGWKLCLHTSCVLHKLFEKLGVHKQITNRLIEPYMYTKGVVTATEEAYRAFFRLRCASDAQPEIKALADAMKAAMDASTPTVLSVNGWHCPYVDIANYDGKPSEAVMISVSCCAQVSYRSMDLGVDKAKTIFDKLNLYGVSGNPHASPCEHQAQYMGGRYRKAQGNLGLPWRQYRALLGV
jgi:hypothetical protein